MIIPLTILLVVIVVIVVIALGCRLVAEQIKDARHGELVRIPFGIIIKMEDDDDE